MRNIVKNGYKIDGVENSTISANTELTRALDFLTAMEICETCIPNSESDLTLGSFKFKINYRDRIISVS